MNEHTLWDGPNAERAVRTANAFEVRRNARRQRLAADPWEGTLSRAYGPSEPQAGTIGYEPSQPAPTHNPALWWALAAVCGLLMWSAAVGLLWRIGRCIVRCLPAAAVIGAGMFIGYIVFRAGSGG